MRVVIDTNIFVAACLGEGTGKEVIAASLKSECQPLMSNALFTEYEDVLARKDIFEKSRLSESERDELLDIFLSCCEWIRIYYTWRPNLADEADNHLIELAVAGNAEYIISRNKRDFKDSELIFPELKVSGPEDFLRSLR